MKRFNRRPSPAFVIACIALFSSMGGVSYGVATGSIDGREIKNGSIRNPDFKNGTLRGQEAKPDGFGGGAIKESTLGQVPNAATAEGVSRFAVVAGNGASARARGATASRRGEPDSGQYQVDFDRDVRSCAYTATLGDPGTGGPGTGQIAVGQLATNPNTVRVVTRNTDGSPADRGFHLTVSC
ncbi:MAG: hypothetical protein ACR2LH_05010 [Thermoleophilaceae bacterium]